MTYQPLKESYIWEQPDARAAAYPGQYANKLAYYWFQFSHLGNKWYDGHIVNPWDKVEGDYEDKTLDRVLKLSKDERYAETMEWDSADPLFSVIPELPKEEHPKSIYPVADSFCSALHMPMNIQLHNLTAMMMLLAHIHRNPDQIKDAPMQSREQQLADVRTAIGTGFKIIEERGLEEDFVKSCAEFETHMPELTKWSEEALLGKQRTEMREREMQELIADIKAMPPEEFERTFGPFIKKKQPKI